MQKIVPHLWFDNKALEAATFYTNIFPESKISSVTKFNDTPSHDAIAIDFSLFGYEFMSINAGPMFKFNKTMSFIVLFYEEADEKDKLTALWDRLIDGGKIIMPLKAYPFSTHYGWVEDKFGLSWQLYLGPKTYQYKGRIMPSFLFTNNYFKQTKLALNHYQQAFHHTTEPYIHHYTNKDEALDGAVEYAEIFIENQPFSFADSNHYKELQPNESIALMIRCDDQTEVDYYWDKLSHQKDSEQCGWCKDKFGISWIVYPTRLHHMMKHGSVDQKKKVTQAFLDMKKLIIKDLEKAYNS